MYSIPCHAIAILLRTILKNRMNSSFSFNSFVYAFTSWCHWSALHIAELEFLKPLWRRNGKQKVAGTQYSIFFFYVHLLNVNLYCKDWRLSSQNYILPQYLEGGFFFIWKDLRENIFARWKPNTSTEASRWTAGPQRGMDAMIAAQKRGASSPCGRISSSLSTSRMNWNLLRSLRNTIIKITESTAPALNHMAFDCSGF